MKSLNKKAILLEEVANLVIALACILLLSYAAFKVYNLLNDNNKKEQAKSNLEEIIAKINNLKDNSQSTTHFYTTPLEWSLVYYDANVINANKKIESKNAQTYIPPVCGASSCLCICPGSFVSNSYYLKERGRICQSNGVCIKTSKQLKITAFSINPKKYDDSLIHGPGSSLPTFDTGASIIFGQTALFNQDDRTLSLKNIDGTVEISFETNSLWLDNFFQKKVTVLKNAGKGSDGITNYELDPTTILEFLQLYFNNCQSPFDSITQGVEKVPLFKTNFEYKDSIEKNATAYLAELKSLYNAPGYVLIIYNSYTSQSLTAGSGRLYNDIKVSLEKNNLCEIASEKEICRADAPDFNTATNSYQARAYVRIYTCSE